MKILAVTPDEAAATTIQRAQASRWPNSMEIIITPTLDEKLTADLHDFNCVIVDNKNKEAASFTKFIRSISAIPVLFIVDPHGDQMDTAFVLTLGNTDYLFKPLEIKTLVCTIETLVNSPRNIAAMDSEIKLSVRGFN